MVLQLVNSDIKFFNSIIFNRYEVYLITVFFSGNMFEMFWEYQTQELGFLVAEFARISLFFSSKSYKSL